jgi:hypothetical protein
LILAPHPDVAEFGLGGTITRLIENGVYIHAVVFLELDKSVNEKLKSLQMGSFSPRLIRNQLL